MVICTCLKCAANFAKSFGLAKLFLDKLRDNAYICGEISNRLAIFYCEGPVVQRIERKFPKLLIRVRFSSGLLRESYSLLFFIRSAKMAGDLVVMAL